MSTNYPELFLYWIKERYEILQKKEKGLPAPWSADPVFQSTYFCNVRREDDKVTKFIRAMYSPYVSDFLFEYNMVLARFINRPKTLEALGYQYHHEPESVTRILKRLSYAGPIWGGAYLITTHGQKMDKLEYLEQVLNLTYDQLDPIRAACRGTFAWPVPLCGSAAAALQSVDGIGSFLAGQVVADLKNTINHPLHSAPDKGSFVVAGPGSIRGASWFHWGSTDHGSPARFPGQFEIIRRYVDDHWPEGVPVIDNQDLQNCLCEFDKYCRVKNGTGRSKRKYDGKG